MRRASTRRALATLAFSLISTAVVTAVLTASGLRVLWLARIDLAISATALGLVAIIYRAEHKMSRGENLKLDALIEASDATDEFQRIERESEARLDRVER